MERKEAQLRRTQWAKLVEEARAQRDERVARQGPTAKISHAVEAVAHEERRQAEAQMFRERSKAVLEQKTNALFLRQEAAVAAKEARAKELRLWREGYWAQAAEQADGESSALIAQAAAERRHLERELIAFDDAE